MLRPSAVSTATESAVLTIFPNNKWTGATHNTGGNQTAINGVLTGIQYDAENRMVQVTSAGPTTSTYSYDGEGRRVQRVSGGVTTQYVYDTSGELAAEYSSAPSSVSGTKIPVEDHLGSIRGELNTSGTYDECYDFLPFGQTISGYNRTASCFTPASSTTAMKFTGKERDAETGLDFFGARFASAAEGSPHQIRRSTRANRSLERQHLKASHHDGTNTLSPSIIL